tara:strand:+ start:616 stop:1299 length:684 start_codon:yes stop_codon:yes gene_type:complete
MRFFDIKTNIIPRVDPNCDSISESLKLLNKFRNNNIIKICSTPNYFDLENKNINEIVINIQKEASKLENFEIPEIYTSTLYPINTDLIGLDEIISINNSRFLICKFPNYGIPRNYLEKLKYFVNNNYIPILTNIENSQIKIKSINELIEIGCFFDIDINNFFNFKTKTSIKYIKYMENKNSILTISGFNKLENFNNNFEKFSKQTKIDLDKLKKIYCWENPNLIISS